MHGRTDGKMWRIWTSLDALACPMSVSCYRQRATTTSNVSAWAAEIKYWRGRISFALRSPHFSGHHLQCWGVPEKSSLAHDWARFFAYEIFKINFISWTLNFIIMNYAVWHVPYASHDYYGDFDATRSFQNTERQTNTNTYYIWKFMKFIFQQQCLHLRKRGTHGGYGADSQSAMTIVLVLLDAWTHTKAADTYGNSYNAPFTTRIHSTHAAAAQVGSSSYRTPE